MVLVVVEGSMNSCSCHKNKTSFLYYFIIFWEFCKGQLSRRCVPEGCCTGLFRKNVVQESWLGTDQTTETASTGQYFFSNDLKHMFVCSNRHRKRTMCRTNSYCKCKRSATNRPDQFWELLYIVNFSLDYVDCRIVDGGNGKNDWTCFKIKKNTLNAKTY